MNKKKEPFNIDEQDISASLFSNSDSPKTPIAEPAKPKPVEEPEAEKEPKASRPAKKKPKASKPEPEEDPWVLVTSKLRQSTHMRIKIYCAMNNGKIQDILDAAVDEYLDRVE